jgi:dipeptidyl aminopeptidase/acylaminoacyl peptidase
MPLRLTFLFLIVLFQISSALAQVPAATAELTIEKIMQDPKWMGTSPSNVYWGEDSKKIYFDWNPTNAPTDSLYVTTLNGKNIAKVGLREKRALPAADGVYNRARTRKAYEKNGDIFLLEVKTGAVRQITSTQEREYNPVFSFDEQQVHFTQSSNLFGWQISTGELRQLTNFIKGRKADEGPKTDQERWLREQQLALFGVVQRREEEKKQARRLQELTKEDTPKEIFTGEKGVDNVALSPDQRYVTYRLRTEPAGAKTTIVPNYVTASGFTEDLSSRTKVGAPLATYELGVYDRERDTTFLITMKDIEGLQDQPAYRQKYQLRPVPAGKDRKAGEERRVLFYGPFWSENGKNAVAVARSVDNKDRWILRLDLPNRTVKLLDRQRDEAWVGGPGIGYGPGEIGWMLDQERVWFHSEEAGYSHLYTVDVRMGEKKALTSGKFEIQAAQLSRDKKHWYLTANLVHPGEKHLYRMPVEGGKLEQLTSMSGAHEMVLSPDEKHIAFRHSYANRPWELYVMKNRPGATPRQITYSLSEEFKAYPWRDPEVVKFKATDGTEVFARLYRPAQPVANGPAVVFVHGAGYLQNAHKWWSQYFREYMFHNFLADQGYTVLDIDYRGSAGYGRDIRTGIYRSMGDKDLTDQVDGARFLTEQYGVDPKRIGIYGGSYGGFITLMAMFTKPDVFAAGAALRSVTDWAHYNHGYTANILNEPFTDSLAYVRSSPIYHAEGLKGALLICHGMVDTNVHFQDVVRLAQRLIELGKENWELAVYPVEGHAFTEPSSWTDEYKRIFRLFETNVKKQNHP